MEGVEGRIEIDDLLLVLLECQDPQVMKMGERTYDLIASRNP